MNLLEKKRIHNTTLSYGVGQNRKWDRQTDFPTNQFTRAGLSHQELEHCVTRYSFAQARS